jgi:hypothetical protein
MPAGAPAALMSGLVLLQGITESPRERERERERERDVGRREIVRVRWQGNMQSIL